MLSIAANIFSGFYSGAGFRRAGPHHKTNNDRMGDFYNLRTRQLVLAAVFA